MGTINSSLATPTLLLGLPLPQQNFLNQLTSSQHLVQGKDADTFLLAAYNDITLNITNCKRNSIHMWMPMLRAREFDCVIICMDNDRVMCETVANIWQTTIKQNIHKNFRAILFLVECDEFFEEEKLSADAAVVNTMTISEFLSLIQADNFHKPFKIQAIPKNSSKAAVKCIQDGIKWLCNEMLGLNK